MPNRKRVRVNNESITGTGGGGGTGGGTVNWGPEFGGPSPHHPQVAAALAYGNVDLTGTLKARAAVDLASTSLTGTVGAQTVLDGALDASYAVNDVQTVLDGGLSPDFAVQPAAQTVVDGSLSPDFAVQPAAQTVVDLNQIDATGTTGVNGALDRLEWQTGEILATGDTFVPMATTLGDCNDTNNYDGNDLQCSNEVGDDNRHIWIKWDLSGLPSNATVTDATLTYNNTPRPPDSSATRQRYVVDTASDSDVWEEETITCDNAPAIDSRGTLEEPATAGEHTNDLDASNFHSRIESRMGVGDFSLILEDIETLSDGSTWESKDEGTNDSLGPRLELTFTTPV